MSLYNSHSSVAASIKPEYTVRTSDSRVAVTVCRKIYKERISSRVAVTDNEKQLLLNK